MRIAITAISSIALYAGIHLITKSEVEGATIVGVFDVLAGLYGFSLAWIRIDSKKGRKK